VSGGLIKDQPSCEVEGSHGGNASDSSYVECYSVSTGRYRLFLAPLRSE
jgi:hypothetical protein